MFKKIKDKFKSLNRKIRGFMKSKRDIFTILMSAIVILMLFSITAFLFTLFDVAKSNQYYKEFTQENSLEKIRTLIDKKEITSYNNAILLKNHATVLDVFTTKHEEIEYNQYIVFNTTKNKKIGYKYPYINAPSIDIFNKTKDDKNNLYNVKYDDSVNINIGTTLFDIANMTIIIAMFLIIFIAFQKIVGEVIAGKNFKPSNQDLNITFDDVIGYDDVKKEFQEIIRYINHKKEYINDDLMVPKGILLTGDPGVGKTMFAKAFANEIKANIYFANGADFAELYVGVGAKRVRSLFASARVNTPSVIFIDEFDAIGSRESNMNDSERLSVINQLLTEMDGLNKKGELFFIATTNHESKIDPALLRPGRIDKKINIPLPDKTTREGIIKKYLGHQYDIKEETLNKLTVKTQHYSGAMLKSLIEQAKMLAFRTHNTKTISNEILDTIIEDTIAGIKQNTKLNDEQIKIIAYHEVGHAYITHKLLPNDEVNKITIEPRGKALGYTMTLPLEEVFLYNKQEILNKVCMLLGGRAAEDVFIQKITNGCADDLQKANQIINQLITNWGMSDINPLVVNIYKENQAITPKKESEIGKILATEYTRAKDMLNQDRAIIEKIVTVLLEKKNISKEEFEQLVKV